MSARYRYITGYPANLREGDQIRMADGETWSTPIRPKGLKWKTLPTGANAIYTLWTDTRPGHGGPDLKLYSASKIRIRRPRW